MPLPAKFGSDDKVGATVFSQLTIGTKYARNGRDDGISLLGKVIGIILIPIGVTMIIRALFYNLSQMPLNHRRALLRNIPEGAAPTWSRLQ